MKKKIGLLLIFLLFFAVIGIYGYLVYDNYRLNKLVTDQHIFIKEITGKDSVYLNESSKYRDSLKKYTEKISWYVKGKEVTSNEFLNAYKKIESEKDSIQNILEYARETYGFDIRSRSKNDSTTTIYRGRFSKADSAEITYYFFKDRIKKNAKNVWNADLTSKKDIDELNNGLRKLIDSMKIKKN